jgi:hypothetical protein
MELMYQVAGVLIALAVVAYSLVKGLYLLRHPELRQPVAHRCAHRRAHRHGHRFYVVARLGWLRWMWW